MIKVDMWYNDKKEQTTGLDIWFNDLGCFYSGNITIFDKIVGDYHADNVQEICEAFPHLKEKNKRLFELNKTISGGAFPPVFLNMGGLRMNKTIISFAKKYNMEYTEIKFMYGLTGYRFDFDLNDYNTMSWCKSMLSAHKNLIVEANTYAMCVTVYDRQEKEKACAFYELVKKLHDIFNLEYHETKDGSRAYNKVVGFVELHQEYKPAFDSIYN